MDTTNLPALLRVYYSRLFPYAQHQRWLTYGRSDDYYNRREIAFILADDVHLRYRSFDGLADFRAAVKRHQPYKIDVGAVFSTRPRDHKKVLSMSALERELVFDIDMTDYDDVRSCCQKGAMCAKCWKWMLCAIKVVDTALLEEFGYEHRMWIFSGRRGVHCWVMDASARALDNRARQTIVEHMDVIGNSNAALPDLQTPVSAKQPDVFHAPHPMVTRAFRIITGQHPEFTRDYFGEIACEQGWLGDDCDGWRMLLDRAKSKETKEKVLSILESEKFGTPLERWNALKRVFGNPKMPDQDLLKGACSNYLVDLVVQIAYPRLDANVSKSRNHLLKSPFCVHPKTGRIAVPLNVRTVDKLDIDTTPRLDELVVQLKQSGGDENAPPQGGNEECEDYKRTTLGPYVDYFAEVCARAVDAPESAAEGDRPAVLAVKHGSNKVEGEDSDANDFVDFAVTK